MLECCPSQRRRRGDHEELDCDDGVVRYVDVMRSLDNGGTVEADR